MLAGSGPKTLLAGIVAIVTVASLLTPASAQPGCRFVLGFAALRDLVGAQKVGNCLEDEHFNLENGDAEQRTSGGLLVWRKADNFTAFTDGGTTWVNGPNGLQSRPNGKRFAWEKEPIKSNTGPTQPNASSAQSPQTPPQGSAPVAQSSPAVPSQLQEAWDALTGLGTRIPGGQESDTLGSLMRMTASATNVTLLVGQLPDGVAGEFKV